MIKVLTRYIIIIIFLGGCYDKTSSKWKVIMPEADQLSNENKIAILKIQSAELLPSSLAAIANIYDELEDWPMAMETINDAIELQPMNSSFHTMKARYAFLLDQKSVAYREALTAYQLGAKSLQQSLELAKMAAALAEFSIVGDLIDSLVLIYPNDLDIIYVAARKYDQEGNVELAKKNYQVVMNNRPENLQNLLYYVRLMFAQKDFEKAKIIINNDSLLGTNLQVINLKADIYFALEDYDSAALFYRLVLTQQQDTTAFNAAINAYSLADNIDSTISVAELAVGAYPDNKFYLYEAAFGLDKKYQFDEALVYYLTLHKLDTLDTLVAAELAYLQRKIAYLQRRNEAQKKLADSLKIVLQN